MKILIGTLFAALLLISCDGEARIETSVKNSSQAIKKEIGQTLDHWHKAAAKADFDAYLSLMTDDAVYIGTDATENWNLDAFKKFAKPYFEQGKAWAFHDLERNIYLSENGEIAWFDELLKTHMGLCRGSGVLVKELGKWKIKHFVLSMTVPNKNVEEATRMKRNFDQHYMEKLSAEKK